MSEETSGDKYYQVIGERISRRRKALKMRQSDLAELIGIARVSISNMEVGRHMPSIPTLYCIAKALKTDIHDLLPKDINEVDEYMAHIAINNLAESIGLDPVKHEQELREMLYRINKLKEGKYE